MSTESKHTKVEAKFLGRLSVSGVGRVGSYESACIRKRSRARRHWEIKEDAPNSIGGIGSVSRDDLGKFGTKGEAIGFLQSVALSMGLKIQGDLHGYPSLQLPTGTPTQERK